MARGRTPDLARVLSFGGRVPPAVGGLLAALVVLSIANELPPRGAVFRVLSLDPGRILGLQLWRLATWTLLEDNALGLIFGGLMLWQMGGQLCWSWGSRRFLLTFFGIAAGAGAATVVAALVWAPLAVPQASVWPVLMALLVVWALGNPDRQFSWFGVLPMTGRMMAWTVLGGTVLFAIFSGAPSRFLPHFVALGIAWWLAGGGGLGPLRRLWYRLRAELHVRRTRRRARHLEVVGKRNGKGGPTRWVN